MEMNFAVVGLTRDSSRFIRQEVSRLDSKFPRTSKRTWFVVESDSGDETVRELARIRRERPNFDFQSLGKLESDLPDRTSRLAVCRNHYLDWLDASSEDFSHLLVLDLDRICKKLSWQSISACLDVDEDWDAQFANQRFYYDLYALRHPVWNQGDPFVKMQQLVDFGIPKQFATELCISAAMVSIPQNSPLIEVDSAFGGAGLYKVSSLRAGYRYSGVQSGRQVSEHVPFHNSMRLDGLRLYINPAFYVADYTEHTAIKRPVRSLVSASRRTLFAG